jgi:flagellar motility protein MotE (MotC chaperone)
MEFRLRLMPVAIAAAVGLLGVKLADVWLAVDAPVPMARAQTADKPAQPAAPPATPPAAAPSAAMPPAAGTAAAPATKPPAAGMAATASAKPAAGKPAIDPLSMSPSEVELLQQLAERRAELDKRAAAISQREVVLQAAEKRIDEKIAKLETLKKDIGGIVDKQNAEDAARLESLVKIYSTMKPVDAARIFSQLDMPVLLGVLEHMKERNAAPILAAMDPGKAKAVTLALAERRDQRVEAAVEAQAQPQSKTSAPAGNPPQTPAKP